jgi:hypothetical protein
MKGTGWMGQEAFHLLATLPKGDQALLWQKN